MIDETEQEKIIKDIQEDFNIIKSESLKVLNGLKEKQVMNHYLLQHEVKRLSKKFGEDHPRTLQMAARLENNLSLVNELEARLEVARIETPDVTKDEALVHGRVFDEKSKGEDGLSVRLENKNGDVLYESETDPSGYYSFVMDEEKIAEISKRAEDGIILSVYDKNGKPVQKSESVLVKKGDRAPLDFLLKKDAAGRFQQSVKRTTVSRL